MNKYYLAIDIGASSGRHIFDGRQFCDDCFENENVICDCCENRV